MPERRLFDSILTVYYEFIITCLSYNMFDVFMTLLGNALSCDWPGFVIALEPLDESSFQECG